LPLLVVPLAADELELLTLREWDELTRRRRVWFEHPDHPLLARLRENGADARIFDDELDAAADGDALVADPRSPRVLELARAGAEVTSGAARLPDALSAAHAAPVIRRAAAALAGAAGIMARLRSDDGCPWDREQTHESLKTHALEEAYEVVEAIDRGTLGPDLAEELGDLLLQVLFHARLAEQEGRFDAADVGDAIVAKLIRRHPHVFADSAVEDAAEVVRNWEAIKGAEKERKGPFEDIPSALPGLLAAAKTVKRAASLGYSPDEDELLADVRAALDRGDLGEALLALAALARRRGSDAETLLLAALVRFRRRWEGRSSGPPG
jgi:XTP/dITP diphosphohydrolase